MQVHACKQAIHECGGREGRQNVNNIEHSLEQTIAKPGKVIRLYQPRRPAVLQATLRALTGQKTLSTLPLALQLACG